MTQDIVLITVESWREDHHDYLTLPDGFEAHRGLTVGHYTRPALAGLLTGRYRDAAQARPEIPTLASRLSDAGYTTIGVSYSPQTARELGFKTGFKTYEGLHPDDSAVSRGSRLRERLARFAPVRALHRRLAPKRATLDALPSDQRALATALRHFENADPPRFLWVHLMDTHRPYGRGSDALDNRLDAKAAAAGPGRSQRALTPGEDDRVRQAYRAALRRAGDRLRPFFNRLPSDAAVAICGDHGEELGERGYYYHGGYRQRLVDKLVRVPLATRNVPICGDQVSLIDLAPTLAAASNASLDGLDGLDRQWHPSPGGLTLAPWAGDVAVRWTGPSGYVVLNGDGVKSAFAKSTDSVPDGVEKQLRALGYASAGD